jgi:inner membrane protein
LASVGHVVVGACAAVWAGRGERGLGSPWKSKVIMSGLSLLPDADVVGFALGVRYEDPFGHRGASHSIVFALLAAIACAMIARRRSEDWRRVGALVFGVVLSHGLLDMLTDGGLGVAIFWPSNERYFFPWRPIPVAPIGRAFLSSWGLRVAITEILYALPILLVTARPWRWRRGVRGAAPPRS